MKITNANDLIDILNDDTNYVLSKYYKDDIIKDYATHCLFVEKGYEDFSEDLINYYIESNNITLEDTNGIEHVLYKIGDLLEDIINLLRDNIDKFNDALKNNTYDKFFDSLSEKDDTGLIDNIINIIDLYK